MSKPTAVQQKSAAEYGHLGGGPRYWLARARQEPHPVRFLLSRLLWRSGLCRRLSLRIRFPEGFVLHFHPTAMAARLWQEPEFGRSDRDFFARYLKTGDFCIDAGANIGLFAIAAAHFCGEHGSVLAIEPHPKIAAYLRENAILNHQQIQVHTCALGEDEGVAIFSNVYSDDQNSIVSKGDIEHKSENTLEVKIRPLDDVVTESWPDAPSIALLKIDVEGYEKFAFLGATQTLQRTRCVYFEVSPPHCRRFGYEPEEVPELLREQGFSIFRTGAVHWSADAHGVSHPYENLVALRDVEEFEARTGLVLEALP